MEEIEKQVDVVLNMLVSETAWSYQRHKSHTEEKSIDAFVARNVAKVLTIGAKKYDRHNWKKLDDIENRYIAAAQRHMWALLKDESHDPETGVHHAAHAVCCMMFLLENYYLQNSKNKV